jgi:hypothetical protein
MNHSKKIMLRHLIIAVILLATNTLSFGQHAPVIRSKKPVFYVSELTVNSVSKPSTEKSPVQAANNSNTSWYEYKFEPRGDEGKFDVVRKVKRAKMEGQTGPDMYRIDTDNPFSNNPLEEMLLKQVQEVIQKPRTLSIQSNKPIEVSSEVALSDDRRLPVARSFFFSNLCLNRTPDIEGWVDTLNTETEIYENIFLVTERTATAAKLTIKGGRIADKKGAEHFSPSNQRVDTSQAFVTNRLDKDAYSGFMTVELATGIILSAEITRNQEQYSSFNGREFTVSKVIQYKITNRRL